MNKLSVNAKGISGNIVYHMAGNEHRLIDAFGPTVVKDLDDFVTLPVDDQTGDPT